jgi:putative heme-binding domain-containing protein
MNRFQSLRAWLAGAGGLVLLASSMSGDQGAPPAGSKPAAQVRLAKTEAATLAAAVRKSVDVEMPAGVELTLWASERLITDPIAIDVDADGTAYVISSSRANLPLDIRGHADWLPIVHTLKSTEALRDFYRKDLAPENSARNTWIPDLNKDGSRDERDLSELKERIVRIQDTDGDGIADASRVMKEGFSEDPTWDVGGGILSYGGDLFFGMAPGVFRLRDNNGDGVLDTETPVSLGYSTHMAFGGHGISGVMLGPDGRLYWEVGDIGFNVVDKSGKRWAYPSQGAVLRSELDGSGFEVFAAGIRNLQEFSFDEHGNLMSVDNDGDHDGESERVLYIPYGSETGWRSNWQYGKYTDARNNRYNVWMDEGLYKPRHERQAAYILPTVKSWHAGPSGMVYNPGTALSDDWRNYFFVTSFPGAASGARVYGFRLKESGAGVTYEDEKLLLRGVLAIGMRFGAEGALYLTDWITGWSSKDQGRIWKLDTPSAAGSAMRKDVLTLLKADFRNRPVDGVSSLLRHADMRIRQKAQFELARRGDLAPFLAAARDGSAGLGRLHAIWGIAQVARRQPAQAAQLAELLGDKDPEVRAQAAKMIGDVRYGAAGDRLVALLADTAPRVQFFAAEALGRIAYKPAVSALVSMLVKNDDRDIYLRHAGSLALASIGDAAALEGLAQHESRAVRLAAVIALRRLQHAGVARFLADKDELIVVEAARAANDDGGIEGAVAALAATLAESRFTSEPLLRRAISANLRLGTAAAAERVAAFATNAAASAALRAEAISVLGVWPAPSPLDRVDGYHLGTAVQQARDGAAARQAIRRMIDALAKDKNTPEIRVALAEAAGRLEIAEAVPTLAAQLKDDASVDVRLASLGALQALKVSDIDQVMQTALADKDPSVRKAALGILPGLAMSSAAKVQQLTSLIKNASLAERQGALEVLGTLRTAESREALGQYLDELQAGRLAPEVQIDLAEAAQTDGAPALAARLDAFRKSKGADSVTLALREALRTGGDPRRGAQVVFGNPATECTRCHSFEGTAANVGPNLSKIGGSLTRDQLVEALLEPSARIAPGFGTVGITQRKGPRIVGTLREETPTHVVIMEGTPPVERRIAKSEIAERSNPVSPMPPFGLILKPREIRDIVEFLSVLK